ncbi:sulfatase-modifying factor enzyme 1 [Prosthecobacter fusiformis]|uniref:Sulfatase-modifying factor enzyme 1 n=2 Tax=Prosthecobacter fusiformis TaxID=48464 RepID=A0A4R7RSI8_9BACT|nr:sulfatase-modifying factor enzyme 1 [Prosthecobacter fusiformis]
MLPTQAADIVALPPTTSEPTEVKGITPSTATREGPYVNELGMKFVPVMNEPGGKNVLFSVWETRRQDYAAYARSRSGVNAEWEAKEYNRLPVGQGDDHPVVSVSWEDATAFCQWLTRHERSAGRIGADDEYRLPMDAEWSYAVEIGEKEDAAATPEEKNGKLKDVYPWGTGFPPPVNSGNYADSVSKEKDTGYGYIEGYHDGYATTAPVGKYQSNRYGVHDLGGNVWEWCQDKYEPSGENRSVRGGSWFDGLPEYLLASFRSNGAPADRCDDVGFRCVLVLSGE